MINFDKTWTLFLDRDGVINHRIVGGYVRKVAQFSFYEGVPLAMEKLADTFGHIFVVTNQQGIAKGLMTQDDLQAVHQHMKKVIETLDGRIDGIYFCAEKSPSAHRKPNIGMALQAKNDFPAIDFERAIMVGDSVSDIEFGINAGMKTVFITTKNEPLPHSIKPDFTFETLLDFINEIK